MDANELEYITPGSWYALVSKNRELTERVKVLEQHLGDLTAFAPRYDVGAGDTDEDVRTVHCSYCDAEDMDHSNMCPWLLARQALEQSAPDVQS